MQTKPLSPASQAIFDIAKSANDAYLQAWRAGYEAGWKACGNECMKALKAPITEVNKK